MKKHMVIAVFVLMASGVGQAQTFRKTKMVDGKGREVPVELDFDKQMRLLTVKALTAFVVEVSYSSIEKLSYEQASRHLVKEGAILMIASLGAGGIVMLTKSKNRWLYVDYKDVYNKTVGLILKLDKADLQRRREASPDDADAFVLTFARPVAPPQPEHHPQPRERGHSH